MRRFLRRNFPATIWLALVVVVVGPDVVWAEQYEVIPGKSTEVVFDSRAPMEKFQGKTGQVLGWLTADLDDLTSPVEMEVSVELASFDTGLGKRNTHMRENHFETDKYPVAVFRGGKVSGATAKSVAVGATVELTLTGTLDLHGVHIRQLLGSEVGDRCGLRIAGAVDEGIESPGLFDRRRDDRLHIVVVRDVALDADAIDLLSDLVDHVEAASADHDLGAMGREGLADRLAETAVPPDDHSRLARKKL